MSDIDKIEGSTTFSSYCEQQTFFRIVTYRSW